MLEYHKIIESGIDLFGERHLNKNILSRSNGGVALHIHHPTNSRYEPLTYKPDRIFTIQSRLKIVFQVLGSQADKNREIEADIIRAFLCPHVSKILFIVPTEEHYVKLKGISSIIQDTLIEYGTNKKTLPIVITVLIPNTVKTPKNAMDYLIELEKEIFAEKQ